ncbi:baseplate J/gp47 family protein [Enterococcus asini]|uniref:baseplate J/gp47 family protein n=1 Tax=Enterococcus asini TaxID=57732 RepID=UPI0028920311|nr:baseplate J/gp47 family protein [Enterococcus asini]MDT2757359.1 baseplate J/gp47 family protein [Enterococcus asini]
MNYEEIGKYLEERDFAYYLEQAMEQVPDNIDIREGSIMYDALAPACYSLAEFTMQLKNVLLETFTQTAQGGYLDLRAEEHGIKRIAATQAIVKGKFTKDDGTPVVLVEGNRFSSIDDDPVYYSIIKQDTDPLYYTLLAETAGTRGNQYIGQLLPIDHFNGLATAELIEVVIPARDEESDDDLRTRILKTYQVNAFGGNVEDYINLTSAIDGVGAVQVYPVWNGGGTVRVVILNNAFGLPNTTLVNQVQEIISPTDDQKGYGLAPIGHLVTVAGPTQKNVAVSLHVDTMVGVSLDSLKSSISAKLEEHFLTLRKTWANHDDLYNYGQTIYRSQLIVSVLQVEGVANVSGVKFNNADADLTLQMDNTKQEIAFLGTVTYT